MRVDLVEFNPGQDITGVTATVAAKILQEILAKMIQGRVSTTEGTGEHRELPPDWRRIAGYEICGI